MQCVIRLTNVSEFFQKLQNQTIKCIQTHADRRTNVQTHVQQQNAFTDKVESKCHFSAPGRNNTTHHQALQVFPRRVKYRSNTTNFIASSLWPLVFSRRQSSVRGVSVIAAVRVLNHPVLYTVSTLHFMTCLVEK
jgi:hypothetical protein